MAAKKRNPFERSRALENKYARDLRRVAEQIGRIINAFKVGAAESMAPIREAMEKYAAALKPWAEIRAANIVNEVDRQDQRAWREATRTMSRELRNEIRNAPTGHIMRKLQAEQVDYITSMPIHAAERVHELTLKNLEAGGRADHLVKEIMRTGEVEKGRATTIARTETSRVAANLTQGRAEYVGSEGYVWRTVKDSDVRHSHKKMEGKFVRWDTPPTLDGMTGHAGTLPNCRCYSEPVIPEIA